MNVNVTTDVQQKCQKYQMCCCHIVFFQALNAPNLIFGHGSALDPSGELTSFPRLPVSWHCLGCLPQRSISAPWFLGGLQTKFLAMPMTGVHLFTESVGYESTKQ